MLILKEIILVLLCGTITYLIMSELSFVKRWRNQIKESNNSIREAKETIRLIDEELERRNIKV